MTVTPGQIADQLRARIATGEYATSQPLPSLSELETTFGVSRGAARRAVAILVCEGSVVNRQGEGAFLVPSRKVPAPRLVAELLDIEQAELVWLRTTKDLVVFTRIRD